MLSSEKKRRVAIVGAGASGLAAARHALAYSFEPTVFEKSSNIGGLWRFDPDPEVRSVAYNTNMLHSKTLSAFSDFPVSEKVADFMHNSEVLEYLHSYADYYALREWIRFDTEVRQVSRTAAWPERSEWIVEYCPSSGAEHSKTEEFDAVMVCTGLYSKMYRPPEMRMEKKFKGRIIHSGNFKQSTNYENKVVVVVGFGNSAISVACNIALTAKNVYLSMRKGGWLMRKLCDGARPWDTTYNSQFGALKRRVTPKFMQNFWWKRCAEQLCDHRRADIRPNHDFCSQHFTFADALPLHLADGRIRVTPGLLSFSETGVELTDGSVIEHVDEVIFATGYEFRFPFIENDLLIRILYNDFHLYKQIILPDLAPHHNLAIIGHIQPTGCLLPVVEMQCRFFLHVQSSLAMNKRILPSNFDMKTELEQRRCYISLNYIKSQRYTQIEDYVEYMNELATIIGCRPSLVRLFFTDPKLAIACFFGPSTSHQYRISGPQVWQGARSAIINQSQLEVNVFLKSIIYHVFLITVFSLIILKLFGV